MKRILVGLSVVVGTLVMGLTNASASVYCDVDPTVPVGTPLTYAIAPTISLGTLAVHPYLYGTRKTTTFGVGLSL
jgi:hypothetical protein